jgi:hypothetical protein
VDRGTARNINCVAYSLVQLVSTIQADAKSLPEPERSKVFAMIDAVSADSLALFLWARRQLLEIDFEIRQEGRYEAELHAERRMKLQAAEPHFEDIRAAVMRGDHLIAGDHF